MSEQIQISQEAQRLFVELRDRNDAELEAKNLRRTKDGREVFILQEDIERIISAATEKLTKELAEQREHENWLSKQLCQLDDWLIGNAEFDKNGLIDRAEKCKERIRDLVVAEAVTQELREQNRFLETQLSSLTKERDELLGECGRLRDWFAQSVGADPGMWPSELIVANNSLTTQLLAMREALPDPDKLELLAKHFDLQDAVKGNPDHEVQDDLRKWATSIRALSSTHSDLEKRFVKREVLELLIEYVNHAPVCRVPAGRCDCGLAEAIYAARAELKTEGK